MIFSFWSVPSEGDRDDLATILLCICIHIHKYPHTPAQEKSSAFST